jgi:hypothetical protein
MAGIFMAYNGAASTSTTVPFAGASTGTATKTLLQVAVPSGATIQLIEWQINFNGSSAATPIVVELMGTTAAATGGTSFTPQPIDSVAYSNTSVCVGGAALTAYNLGTEVAPTSPFYLEGPQQIAPTNGLQKQWALGYEPFVKGPNVIRLRVTASVAVNAFATLIWKE